MISVFQALVLFELQEVYPEELSFKELQRRTGINEEILQQEIEYLLFLDEDRHINHIDIGLRF